MKDWDKTGRSPEVERKESKRGKLEDMKGQLSISDWLASMAAVQEEKEPPTVPQVEPDMPQEVMIRQGAKWETVTYAQALEWARKKWTKLRGVQEPYRAQYINAHYVKGIEFENNELKGA